MSTNEADLRSVNWMSGMLLTPQQFLRQDAFIQASFEWLLHYCVAGHGLVGGGVRAHAGDRLSRFDPIFEAQDDGKTITVTIRSARGITQAGRPIEIGEGKTIRGEFPKADLAGKSEVLVCVVDTGDKEQDPTSIGEDDANTTHAALLRPLYMVALGAGANVGGSALVVGRIRRSSESTAFGKDVHFIPDCATLMAHSELHAGWTKLQAQLVQLAGDYAELHRMAARYTDYIARRGLDVESDRSMLAFVERATHALDSCVYEIMDPSRPPVHLFQQVDRAGRRIALALDLSESTAFFLKALSSADASYGAILEEERNVLAGNREVGILDDLRVHLQRAEDTLTRIRRLGEALTGKYVDYRINKAIDSLRFLVDGAGEGFYVSVATPAHPHREGDLLTFAFSQLSLTGHHEYRVILLGDPQGISEWQLGDQLRVDLRVNSAAGGSRPTSHNLHCELPRQRNFAVNFQTPSDVTTITGLHVTVQPGGRIRGAVLYQRKLSLTSDTPIALFHTLAPAGAPAAQPGPPAAAAPLKVDPAPESPRPTATPTGKPVIKVAKPKR